MLLLSAIPAGAQLRCEIQHYTTENGLSHVRGTSIIKDAEGFIWTGSWDGINRFDGDEFVSYKSFPGDRADLGNDRIDRIDDDQTGYLWLKGVCEFYRFDKKTQQFKPLSALIREISTHKLKIKKIFSFSKGAIWIVTKGKGLFFMPDTRTGRYYWYKNSSRKYFLPSDEVNFVHLDKAGNVWVGTSAGLASLKRGDIAGSAFTAGRVVGQGMNFADFTEDADLLYFSTRQGYLLVYQKKTGKVLSAKVSDKELNAVRKSAKGPFVFCSTLSGELVTVSLPGLQSKSLQVAPGVEILSMYEDGRGDLWLEPRSKGVIRVKRGCLEFRWFREGNSENGNISSFYKVFEDRAGVLWVSMKGSGLGYYDRLTDQIRFVYRGADDLSHTFPDIIYDIYYDKTGIIWLCTDDGIHKVVLPASKFSQEQLVQNSRIKLDNQVRGLYSDRRGRLWVGSKNGQLAVFDKGKRLPLVFENEPSSGLGSVYAITQDRSGAIWIGTKYRGLYRAVPADQTESRYRLVHYQQAPGELSSQAIFSLFTDQQGRVWIGTQGGGLNLALESKGKIRFYNPQNAFPGYPSSASQIIRCITADQSGNLWLATTEGLLILSFPGRTAQNPVIRRYIKTPGDVNSLGDNDVQFVCRDKMNRMWLSTSGGGLTLALGRSADKLSFKNYLKKDGLPSDYCLSTAEDRQGNLWIATLNGLSRFEIGRKKFSNFDQNDGLLSATFSESSCINLPDGSIAFGTSMGILKFDPATVHNPSPPSNIVLTNFQVNNADVVPGGAYSVLPTNINYVSAVKLQHDQNIISVDFSDLDYKSRNKQAMLYRLKGLSDDWQNDNRRRRATYTNLPPGNYRLEIKPIGEDYPESRIRRLDITVLPPWWSTWWAWLLYMTALGIALHFAFRIVRTILKLRQNIAVGEKMADLKMRFFTSASHELRTPLTLILNPIEEIARGENLSEQGQQYIQLVKKNAGRMIRFMNEWLDLRKLQEGKHEIKLSRVEVISLVRKVSQYFDELSREKKIKLEISSDKDELFARIDAEKIDVVVYNLLANAFKYSPEGKKIGLSIHGSGADFSISVSDEGPGVPPEHLNDIFELYYVGKSQSGKGIGIGLALCKELITLHQGAISASNNRGGGLTVTISLPTRNEHHQSGEVRPADEETHDPDLTGLETGIDEALSVPAADAGAQPLILLVEDNNELRSFLESQLSRFYRVVTAKNGESGFKKAMRLVPDLILSDIMMPVMNGIEMLDKIKHEASTSHIPVVLLTAKASVESHIEGLKYGADFYITKPFNNEYLLAAVDSLIRRRKMYFDAMLENNVVVDLSPGEVVITKRDEEFLKAVIQIVESEMTASDFNIDLVAEAVGMGRTTFYNKFKSLTNLAPVEFVRDMRLKRARQYFDAGETNVSSIAYSVGFNNAKYFSTCFKEKYKISPKDYVKSLDLKDAGRETESCHPGFY